MKAMEFSARTTWFLLLACISAALALGAVASAASTPRASFAAAKGYQVGDGAESIAFGDLNGDGAPDLATANYADATVSVLLNERDGTFEAQHRYATAFSPRSIALDDLTGDGKADLVTANLWDDSVSVLVNKGDGTFAAKHDYETAVGPFDVAIGDLDGDGMADLVSTGDESGTVSVFRNKGDGTFEARRDYETGDGPDSVVIRDLTGDGRPDLVTANGGSATVSVLANRGDGSFGAVGEYNLRSNGFPSVAAGDLNGDGKPDLAVTDSSDGLSVLLSRADGGFQPPHLYPFYASRVAIADLNGDAKQDLVGGAGFLLNHGNGSFRPAVELPGGEAVAVGDLNGDGRLDLAGPSSWEAKVSVLINTPGLCNVQSASGLTLSGAHQALARGNCAVGKIRRAYSPYVKKGLVISQKPKFGAVLRGGSRVDLVISKGRRR
jgi:hypothetical protein